jgi:hypothetical protein
MLTVFSSRARNSRDAAKYEEKESALVDVGLRVGDLPFANNPTFIQSGILGTAHLEGEGSYPLTVTNGHHIRLTGCQKTYRRPVGTSYPFRRYATR